MLRQVVREFVAKHLGPRAEEIEETGTTPPEVFQGLVDLGLIGMPYAEAYGGGGADLLTSPGYMKDYPVERMVRQAKLLQIVEGTNQIQRVMIAKSLLT